MGAWSQIIKDALNRPSGARFFRCALQVNPFEYIQRYSKNTLFSSEEEYNDALLDALGEQGVEVIAITDHYRIKSGASLATSARAWCPQIHPESLKSTDSCIARTFFPYFTLVEAHD